MRTPTDRRTGCSQSASPSSTVSTGTHGATGPKASVVIALAPRGTSASTVGRVEVASPTNAVAAGSHPCAACLCVLHERFHGGKLQCIDHRTHLHARLECIADLNLLDDAGEHPRSSRRRCGGR